MAKLKKVYSFKNAEISKNEDNHYILTEVNKDDTQDFDLSSLLDGMIGINGIAMNFGSEDIIPNIED